MVENYYTMDRKCIYKGQEYKIVDELVFSEMAVVIKASDNFPAPLYSIPK